MTACFSSSGSAGVVVIDDKPDYGLRHDYASLKQKLGHDYGAAITRAASMTIAELKSECIRLGGVNERRISRR